MLETEELGKERVESVPIVGKRIFDFLENKIATAGEVVDYLCNNFSYTRGSAQRLLYEIDLKVVDIKGRDYYYTHPDSDILSYHEKIRSEILELFEENPSLSTYAICKRLGYNHVVIKRAKSELDELGQLPEEQNQLYSYYEKKFWFCWICKESKVDEERFGKCRECGILHCQSCSHGRLNFGKYRRDHR